MALLRVPSVLLRNTDPLFSSALCKTHLVSFTTDEYPRGRFRFASLLRVTVVGSFGSESIRLGSYYVCELTGQTTVKGSTRSLDKRLSAVFIVIPGTALNCYNTTEDHTMLVLCSAIFMKKIDSRTYNVTQNSVGAGEVLIISITGTESSGMPFWVASF
jgi:hypothetical protein